MAHARLGSRPCPQDADPGELGPRLPAAMDGPGPARRPHPARDRRPRATRHLTAGGNAPHHGPLHLRGGHGGFRRAGIEPAAVGGRRFHHRPALRGRDRPHRAHGVGALHGPGVAAGGHRGSPGGGRGPVAPGMDRRLPLRSHHHRVPGRCGGDHRRAPASRPLRAGAGVGVDPAPGGGRGPAPRPGQRVGGRHRGGGLRRRRGGRAHRPQAPRGTGGPGGLDARRRRRRSPRTACRCSGPWPTLRPTSG